MKDWYLNTYGVEPNSMKNWGGPQWVFYLFVLYNFFNVGAILTLIVSVGPINVAVFFVVAIYLFIKLRYRFFKRYFMVAWLFFILYIIFGFIGERSVFNKDTFQHFIKYWISLIAIPWLAIVVIKKEDLYIYLKTFIVGAFLGGLFAVFQLFAFDYFQWMINSGNVRGAGFWINPNMCGFMLISTLFLTMNFKAKRKPLLAICRLFMVFGVMATLSRTSLAILAGGAIAFALLSKNRKLVRNVLTSMVVAIGVLIMAIPFMGQYQLNRITSMGDIAAGNDITGKSDNRSFVWIYATGEILNNDPVWGLGHNSMDNIVPMGDEGIGPHNLYIWIWGNSGLVGLGALIFYLFYFFVLARRFSDPLIKASALIFAFLIVANNFMTHALIVHQTTSVGIMFFIVLLFHFDKGKMKEKSVAVSVS